MEQGHKMDMVVSVVSDFHFGTRGVNALSKEATFYMCERAELDRRYEMLEQAYKDDQRAMSREAYVDVLTDKARKYTQLVLDYMTVNGGGFK